jgi:peptidyl-prolyl cis-trans isomerase SurA
VQQVQNKITEDFKVTPSDVRKYFGELPTDSVPYVPLKVEVQIITINPTIPRQEIDDVKARLRDYADRVAKGESEFSTLAILYSEDEGTASRGGEVGFLGRTELAAEYAAVAYNLNDTKKVSKIVETEFGFHIIQLIEKRGDRINTRHILLRPKVADKDLADASNRLDSLRSDIENKKVSFEEVTRVVSQDKDTRYSNGVMVNSKNGTTRFEMSDLPQEVARAVANLQPGELSKPVIMKDPKSNRDIVALIKLTNRIDAHKANLADDYQEIKNMYEQSAKQKMLSDWLEEKIANTYVRIEEGWRGCEFEHKGWVKN